MSTPSDSSRPEFWDTRYARGRPDWARQKTPVHLESFLQACAPGTVLIPGCGAGSECVIRAFHQASWEVTALDFSALAVAQAQAQLGELGRRVLLADFFKHDVGGRRFDACYEQSFLCALPPGLWGSYAERMAELLRPGGRLVGLFFFGQEPEPPPYPLDNATAQGLFGSRFALRQSVLAPDSNPFYPGGERWMEWERSG